MPKVLNIKDYGYRIPDGAIYVGRAMPRYNLSASKWGNPFKAGEEYVGHIYTRQDAIEEFENWLFNSEPGRKLLLQVYELRGKDLVCWCHTWDGRGENPMYCHADVLLELANKLEGIGE